jgi:Spy/CpxP family protein refolding chaperone
MKALRSLVLALLVVSPVALSEGPAPADPLGDNLFPPDLILSSQAAIGLTDAQKADVRAEVLKVQPRFTDLQWKLQDAVDGLKTLLAAPTADEAKVLEALDRVLSFERDLKRSQIGLMVRLKNLLSADQQGKLRQAKARGKTS